MIKYDDFNLLGGFVDRWTNGHLQLQSLFCNCKSFGFIVGGNLRLSPDSSPDVSIDENDSPTEDEEKKVEIINNELQADDLLAMETTPKGMRTLIYMIYDMTKISKISFTPQKCGIVVIDDEKR